MNEHPEKIYNWLDTQLSIARHYGGIKFNGRDYVIDYKSEGQPLVLLPELKIVKRIRERGKAITQQMFTQFEDRK